MGCGCGKAIIVAGRKHLTAPCWGSRLALFRTWRFRFNLEIYLTEFSALVSVSFSTILKPFSHAATRPQRHAVARVPKPVHRSKCWKMSRREDGVLLLTC